MVQDYKQIHITSTCRRRCALWHTAALLPVVPCCMERSVLIQRNGSRQDGGKLPGVRVVGAADAPDPLAYQIPL